MSVWWRKWDVEIVSAVLILVAGLALFTQSGCSDVIEASSGESPAETAERICIEQGWDCQRVYAFLDVPAENPLGLLEMCVHERDLDMAGQMFGRYELSPHERFDTARSFGIEPICIWCGDLGRGCNAFGGCWNCRAVP